MRKKWLWILIGLALCGGLAGGIYWVSGLEEPVEEQPPTISDVGLVHWENNIRVYQFEPKNVAYLHISNPYGEYQVRMDSDLGVVIDGYETVPLLQASSLGLFNSVATVTLDDLIKEDCQDLAEFGLKDPQAVITIHTVKGDDYRFAIGNQTLDADGYYMCVAGDDDVYLMSEFFAGRYLRSIADYCDKKIYKTFDYEEDFRQLRITGRGNDILVRTVTDEESATGLYFDGLILTAPFSSPANRSSILDLLEDLIALQATGVEAMCVTEADYPKYGLDDPVKVEISVYADPNPLYYNNQVNAYFDSTKPTGEYADFTVTYYIGNTVDHDTYVMFENYPVVYVLSDEVFSFLSKDVDWYCARLIFGDYIYNVKDLVFTVEGKDYVFSITDADLADEMLVTCDGITVDNGNFRSLYGNLVAISHYGLAEKPAADTPLLTVTYHRINDTDVVVEFFEIDARNAFVAVNGEGHFSVLRTAVDKVIRDMFKVLNGEPVL